MAEHNNCEKWMKHRKAGEIGDSFKCYQKINADVGFILENGFDAYWALQREREAILNEMLTNYNEGRSKSYYCIAATVMEIEELRAAPAKATRESGGWISRARQKGCMVCWTESRYGKNMY